MHAESARWFATQAEQGWASCPITQNGCVRIMSHASYPNPLRVGEIVDRLAEATATSLHAFWADDVSLLDPDVADRTRIHGPRQVTDVYLLALAVRHSGVFASFDRSIPVSAVRGATREHVVRL